MLEAISVGRASSRTPKFRAFLATCKPKPRALARGVAVSFAMYAVCHRAPAKTADGAVANPLQPRLHSTGHTQPIRPDSPLALNEPQPVTWSYPVPALKPVVPWRVLLPVVTSWKPVPYEDPLPIE